MLLSVVEEPEMYVLAWGSLKVSEVKACCAYLDNKSMIFFLNVRTVRQAVPTCALIPPQIVLLPVLTESLWSKLLILLHNKSKAERWWFKERMNERNEEKERENKLWACSCSSALMNCAVSPWELCWWQTWHVRWWTGPGFITAVGAADITSPVDQPVGSDMR